MQKLVVIIITTLLLLAKGAGAQNPVSWTYSAKKLSDLEYEIRVQAKIQPGWSIYSQHTPEGGPVATTLGFGTNPLVSVEGKVVEEGVLKKKHEELFGVDVHYFREEVSFVQRVKRKKKVKTNVSGWLEFMACNDTQCLPPKKITFTITIP